MERGSHDSVPGRPLYDGRAGAHGLADQVCE